MTGKTRVLAGNMVVLYPSMKIPKKRNQWISGIIPALAGLLFCASAQGADLGPTIGDVRPLSSPGHYLIAPEWSSDGSMLACTGEKYRGIWVMDKDGKNLRQLSDEDLAGFKYQWIPKSRWIVYRARENEDLFLRGVDASGARVTARGPVRELSAPSVASGGVNFAEEGRLLRLDLSGKTLPATTSASCAYADEGRIYVENAGKRIAISDDRDTYYLPVVSPDGKRILYEGLVSGIHLADIDGKNSVLAGRGNNPRWSADGKWIVYDITTDDGNEITSGDLFLWDVAAGKRIQITRTDKMIEQRPALSPDNRNICWDAGGVIYTGKLPELK